MGSQGTRIPSPPPPEASKEVIAPKIGGDLSPLIVSKEDKLDHSKEDLAGEDQEKEEGGDVEGSMGVEEDEGEDIGNCMGIEDGSTKPGGSDVNGVAL